MFVFFIHDPSRVWRRLLIENIGADQTKELNFVSFYYFLQIDTLCSESLTSPALTPLHDLHEVVT